MAWNLEAAREVPALTALCTPFDQQRILADLRVATRISPLINQVAQLTRLASDAHRSSLARAYASVLPLYRVAREMATFDTSLLLVITPLQEMYAARKKPAPAASSAPTAPAPVTAG